MGVTNFDIVKVNQLISAQGMESTGKVWFVGNSTTAIAEGAIGGSDGNSGESPITPFATIDYAISRCTADRGDVIYVLPNHSETHAAANAGLTGAITLDVEGIAIVGLGFGDDRPKLLANFAVSTIDLIEVTADSCKIKNLIFVASTTAAPEARIDVADTHCEIVGCEFRCGAFDAQSITVAGTGDDVIISDNKFLVTADGPNSAIQSIAAVERLAIVGCYFDGGSTTNQWDDAALDLDAAANTNCVIQSNIFNYGTGLLNHAAATGIVVNNAGGEPYVIGLCAYFPFGGAGGSVQVIQPESTSGSATAETTTGDVYYVNSTGGNDANPGGLPSQPLATLAAAIDLCTANQGDTIVLMPGHAEDVLVQIDADIAGIKIIGMGNGEVKPTLKNSFAGGTAATLRIDADDIEIAGVQFGEGDTANTIGNIELVAGADDVYIHDCVIEQGANDAQGITFLGACAKPVIKNNLFRITANGPDEAILCAVGAITNAEIEGNVFDGMSITNSWDDGVISSDQANTTIVIKGNLLNQVAAGVHAIICSSTTATGLIEDNIIAGNAAEFGINAGELTLRNNTIQNTTGRELQSEIATTGKYVFVDSNGGLDTNTGLTARNALATIDAAVALCTADNNDHIIAMPGHAETPATATTFNVAGVTLLGIGSGANRPSLAVNGVVDGITITATDVRIKNMLWLASTAAVTSQLNIESTDAVIEDCRFVNGANDASSITIVAASTDTIIRNCSWVVTADGPNRAIDIEGISAGIQIENNYFDGLTIAASWDDAAVFSAFAHTNCLVKGNTFRFAAVEYAIEFSAAATGSIFGNDLGDGIVDPGNCYVNGNSGAEYGTSQLPVTTGRYIFVDNATGSDVLNLGYSPSTPLATVGVAIAKCTAERGDVVVLMPGHEEILAATITLDVDAMSLIGLKDGNNRPTLTVNDTIDGIDITADDVIVKGIAFEPSTGAATSHLNIDGENAKVSDCMFLQGAQDLESITITANGVRAELSDNIWFIAADNPDRAINIEAAGAAGVVIEDNIFIGDPVNGWDDAAIYSVANVVGTLIERNTIVAPAINTHGVSLGATSTPALRDNYIIGNTPEYSVLIGSGYEENTSVTETSALKLNSGVPITTGKYLFVNSVNGAATYNGVTPKTALATIAAAVALCSADNYDTIIVLPGHAEAPTATIDVDTAGIQIIGLGIGDVMPTITPDATGGAFSVITVGASDIKISGLQIAPESSGNDTADQVHINAGLDDIIIEKCEFNQGANDPLSIVFAGASFDPTIQNCRFNVTADGPNNAIIANAGVINRAVIKDNLFDGNTAVFSWDDGVILSDQANASILIENNKFLFGVLNSPAIELDGASTGLIKDNFIAGYSEGYGIDAGVCDTIGNRFANDARMDWKALPYTTSKYVFVDSNVVNEGDGLSPDQAVNDLNAGIAIATTGFSDVVICMPGHTETLELAAQIDVDNDGIAIIGLGYGDNRPTFIPDNTAAYAGGMWTVTGDDVLIENIVFGTAVAAANNVQSQLEIVAGGDDIVIKNCRFDQGQYDLIAIDFPGTADNVKVEGCEFVVGANGPTAAIANDNGVIIDCKYLNNSFNGGSLANSWDDGAIYSTQVNTGMIIESNKLIYGAAAATPAINLTAGATGLIKDNSVDGTDPGYNINPGNCTPIGNVTGSGFGGFNGRAIPAPYYSNYVPGLGFKVIRAPGDILDGTQFPVFNVNGGRVLVTCINMEVVGAALGAAANVKFMTDPTIGTDADMCMALAVAADEAGTLYSIMDSNLPMSGGSGGGAALNAFRFILAEGTIDVDSTADTNLANGATESVEIWYIPLDFGANITVV